MSESDGSGQPVIQLDELVALLRTWRGGFVAEMRENQGVPAVWEIDELPREHVYAQLSGLTALLRELGFSVAEIKEGDDPVAMVRFRPEVKRDPVEDDDEEPKAEDKPKKRPSVLGRFF